MRIVATRITSVKRTPSIFKGRKNQLRLMHIDTDGSYRQMSNEDMADTILGYAAARSRNAQVEIYVWPYWWKDTELNKTEPSIGFVFKNGVYIGHGLGDDGRGKDKFSVAVKAIMDPMLDVKLGKARLMNAFMMIEKLRERTVKVWK